MPLYEYRCSICGTQEEKLQPISAPENHDCPECEAPAGMKRQVSVAAFSLSGGGWYKQGYGGAPAKKEGSEAASDKPTAAADKSAAEAPAPASSKPAAPGPVAPGPAAPSSGGGCAGGCACH